MQIEATYELHIKLKSCSHDTINKILGVEGSAPEDDLWCYSITESADDEEYDFINRFLDILEGKETDLLDEGVVSSDILFWYLYCHDGQCSFQFEPQQMKRLGEAGIKLCVLAYPNEQEAFL